MKSTLKIAFQSNMNPELPVIKIVQPIEYHQGKFNPSEDIDVKDEMLNAFLSLPSSVKPYPMFRVSTSFPNPFEGDSTHWITTIAPVQEGELLYTLRHMVLNRFVPYDTIVWLNGMSEERLKEYLDPQSNIPEIHYEGSDNYQKIHEFFDWLNTLQYASEKEF